MTPRARRRQGQAFSDALQGKPDLVRALKRAGARRKRHLTAADQELQGIVPLAAEALAAGANLAEVAELAGVSRPTLYRLLEDRQ